MTKRDVLDQSRASVVPPGVAGLEQDADRSNHTAVDCELEKRADPSEPPTPPAPPVIPGAEKIHSQQAQIAQMSATISAFRLRIKERDARLAELDGQIDANRNMMAQMLVVIDDLQANLRQHEIQLREAEESVRHKSAEIAALNKAFSEQNRRLESQQEQLRQELAERATELANVRTKALALEEQIGGILNSRSWRMTAPLRLAGRPLRALCSFAGAVLGSIAGRRQPMPGPNSVSYAVDFLKIQGRRVYGWGWMAGAKEIVSLSILARTAGGEDVAIGSTYGFGREDVAAAHPFLAGAGRSGYVISGWLPEEDTRCLIAKVRFSDGSEESFSMGMPIHREKAWTFKGMRQFRRFARGAYRYLARGEIRIFLQKSRENFGAFVRGIKRGTAGSSGELSRRLSATGSPVVLVIDHNMGGGANVYRNGFVHELRQAKKTVLLVSYDLPSLEFHARVIDDEKEETFRIDFFSSLLEIANVPGIREIFVNNLVSVNDPLAIVDFLPRLREFSGASLTVAVHDYFMLCPSWTLLNHRRVFCGLPEIAVCQECLTHHAGEFVSFVRERDIEAWRKRWRRCLLAADAILCFSEASARLVRKVYPEIDGAKFVVEPHRVHSVAAPVERSSQRAPLHIGVVGEIREHKGARIVQEMARSIAERRLPIRITVIGTIDVACDASVVNVTGRYRQADLARIVADSGVNLCFVPSIWPETFSYVTEELIALHLPLAVFDLGAPAERVRNYAHGLIIEKIDAEHALSELVKFHARHLTQNGVSTATEPEPSAIAAQVGSDS